MQTPDTLILVILVQNVSVYNKAYKTEVKCSNVHIILHHFLNIMYKFTTHIY